MSSKERMAALVQYKPIDRIPIVVMGLLIVYPGQIIA